MNPQPVSRYFWRDFWLALPLLLEIIAALSLARSPWAHYAAYFPPVFVATLLAVLFIGGVMAVADAWRGKR